MTDRERAFRAVLVDCLAVTSGENLLVVTDPPKRAVGEKLARMALELGAETVLMEMSERPSCGSEPPPQVAAAMLASDVIIAPTAKSLSHTEARRAACAGGARAATMPGITEAMLVRTMGADYFAVRRRAAALARALSDGASVRITSPQGTDVTLGIEGRSGMADSGDLAASGSFGNLPAGEGFIAPVEGTTEGRVVFDGAVPSLGGVLEISFEKGYATRLGGPGAPGFEKLLAPYGREAFAVAELGIGCNEAARLTGDILEDEKILGTIHLALGDNHSFGGTVRVPSHIDNVVLHPTVVIDGRTILEDDRLLL